MTEITNAAAQNSGSAFDLLGKSFEAVKNNLAMFVIIQVVIPLLLGIGAMLALASVFGTSVFFGFEGKEAETLDTGSLEISTIIALGLVALIISLFLYAMTTVLALRASQGKKPSFHELVDGARANFWRLLGVALISGLLVVVGLILLIIPGIFLIQRLIMASFFVIDKGMGVIDALNASWSLSKKHSGQVWAALGVALLVLIFTIVLNIIPLIGGLIGTIVSVIWSLVIPLRYVQLQGQKV
jgi:hypothetical protein